MDSEAGFLEHFAASGIFVRLTRPETAAGCRPIHLSLKGSLVMFEPE